MKKHRANGQSNKPRTRLLRTSIFVCCVCVNRNFDVMKKIENYRIVEQVDGTFIVEEYREVFESEMYVTNWFNYILSFTLTGFSYKQVSKCFKWSCLSDYHCKRTGRYTDLYKTPISFKTYDKANEYINRLIKYPQIHEPKLIQPNPTNCTKC